MAALQETRPMARVLRIATAAEVVLLIVSAFFLFTEHRAHFLGALPYGLAAIAITVSLVFLAERAKRGTNPGRRSEPERPGRGA